MNGYLYRLPWPPGAKVTAVDHTQGMIDALWPGPPGSALCADWTEIPLPPGSRDIVLCDGGLTVLTYPHAHQKLVRTLHRLLTAGGRCVFRLYIPPARRESPETVLVDLLAGAIPNLNILKLRLGMAMQDSSARGVKLADMWDALRRVAADLPRLARQIGWPVEHLLAIHTYRNCPARYYFLAVEEILATCRTIPTAAHCIGSRGRRPTKPPAAFPA